MKLRPILFSTAMVQAILEGRKTQTRRVVKPQPRNGTEERFYNEEQPTYLCPYGQPGDILWVLESWTPIVNAGQDGFNLYGYKTDALVGVKWKPSIYMPFAAARIFLRIKAVRVERLQDITEEDAIYEGIGRFTKDNTIYKYGIDGLPWVIMERKPSLAFARLWQSINGPESWAANPWVWVLEFQRVSREEAGL
jgi:hypothetical protein